MVSKCCSSCCRVVHFLCINSQCSIVGDCLRAYPSIAAVLALAMLERYAQFGTDVQTLVDIAVHTREDIGKERVLIVVAVG